MRVISCSCAANRRVYCLLSYTCIFFIPVCRGGHFFCKFGRRWVLVGVENAEEEVISPAFLL